MEEHLPSYNEAKLKIGQLILDPNNYRFQDTDNFVTADLNRFHENSVQDRAYRTLKEASSIAQLKASIVRNGFIPVERIVVRSYAAKPDTFVVIEGNRRVAALRWIAEDDAAGVTIPENVKQTLGLEDVQ
jgi:ParB-like nuclease domain